MFCCVSDLYCAYVLLRVGPVLCVCFVARTAWGAFPLFAANTGSQSAGCRRNGRRLEENFQFELCTQPVVTSIDVTELGCWEVLRGNHNVIVERVGFRAFVPGSSGILSLLLPPGILSLLLLPGPFGRTVSMIGLYRLIIVLRRCQYRADGRISVGRCVRRI